MIFAVNFRNTMDSIKVVLELSLGPPLHLPHAAYLLAMQTAQCTISSMTQAVLPTKNNINVRETDALTFADF